MQSGRTWLVMAFGFDGFWVQCRGNLRALHQAEYANRRHASGGRGGGKRLHPIGSWKAYLATLEKANAAAGIINANTLLCGS